MYLASPRASSLARIRSTGSFRFKLLPVVVDDGGDEGPIITTDTASDSSPSRQTRRNCEYLEYRDTLTVSECYHNWKTTVWDTMEMNLARAQTQQHILVT